MKITKNQIRILTITLFSICLFSCADFVTFNQAQNIDPVGFWYGLWHGIIAPISFIISWFDSDVAIYAIYNNGGWYDFGFLWGIGGLTYSAGSKSK